MGSGSRPESFGPYERLEILGMGGMGVVHRARHRELRREVALKVMRAARADDSEGLQRFDRESRIHLGLNHPNLVKVYDVGIEEDQPWMAMELVRGPNLRAVLDARAPLSEREIREILLDIARGIDHLHARGIVHRDLKPENVLCAEDGVRKITDFGLSRRPDDTMLTEDGAFLGTLAFAAPEALLGHGATPAVDLYAAGVLAYAAATGALPCEGSSMEEWVVKIVNEVPVPPRTRNPAISEELDALILSLLRKYPGERPTAPALLAWLETASPVRKGTAEVKRPDRTEVLPVVSSPPAPRRDRGAIAAALVLGLVLAAAAICLRAPAEQDGTSLTSAVPILPPTALGLLEREIVATSDILYFRARTAEPVQLRMRLQAPGEYERTGEDPCPGTWHRLDVPVPSDRTWSVTFEDVTGRVRFEPGVETVRSLGAAEMKNGHQDLEKQRLGPLAATRIRLQDMEHFVKEVLSHRPVLSTPAAEPVLLELVTGQTYTHLEDLTRLLGRIGGRGTGRLLLDSLDPTQLDLQRPDGYKTFYEHADRVVRALLERGDEPSVEAARRFCVDGEKLWSRVIPPEEMHYLGAVRLRALRHLASYRPDVASRIAWNETESDRRSSAFLDGFLHANGGTLERIRAAPEAVREATLAGILERGTPPPDVTYITSDDWSDVGIESFRLAGPLLATQGRPDGIETLVAASRLEKEPLEPIAAAAGQFLGMTAAPAAIPALFAQLDSPSSVVRSGALHGLIRRAAAAGLTVPFELPRDIEAGTIETVRTRLDRVRAEGPERGLLALCGVLWGRAGAREGLAPLGADPDLLVRWMAAVAHALTGAREPLPMPRPENVTSITPDPVGTEGLADLVAKLPALLAPAPPETTTRIVFLHPLPPWVDTGLDVQIGDRVRVAYLGAAWMERGHAVPGDRTLRRMLNLPPDHLWAQARIGHHHERVAETREGHRATTDFIALDRGRLKLRAGYETYTSPDELVTGFAAAIATRPALALARIEIQRAAAGSGDQPPGPSAPR